MLPIHANTPSWLYSCFLLCDTCSFSQLPQQGDRQCRTVRSVQNLLFPLFLLLFSSTTSCYLLIFICYSMGHSWAVVPQECPCPAMSCSLTVFPWALLPHHGLPAVLKKHILLSIGPSSKTASLATFTDRTFSLFSSATSCSPSVCPHDYHFPLNMSEAGCQELPFSFGTQWDGHLRIKAGRMDFGEICEMIFFFF